MENLGEKIDRYENGEMSEAQELEFFQELVDSGHAWKLQGFYGRAATMLIGQGKVKPFPRVQ